MREGWTYKKLGDIATFINGDRGKNYPSQKDFVDKGIPFINAGHIMDGEIDFDSMNYITENKYNSLNSGKIVDGDILFCLRGSLGKKAIVKGVAQGAIASSLVIIRCNDVYNQYLFHYLNSSFISSCIYKSNNGSSQPNLSATSVSGYIIPIPSLPEQQSIVAELDKINELISLKKAQLSDLDSLAQSIFYDMFGDPIENEKGWEVKNLSDNVQEMFLGPFGSALKVDSYVEKIDAFCMVYEQKHAIQGRLDLENHFINEEKYNSLRRFEVKGGDFIMSCRGTIGKLYQLPIDAPRGIIHPSLMKIRIKEDAYNSTYFKYMLVKIVANENTNGNCVQMAITAKELGKKSLPLPPLSLQQEFAKRIELIEQQKAQISSTIKDLETLLASRMQYWFD
ncbi:restriction endonuclease subunit S [Xylanibacter brevis]|uniref:restriction endonuclease subunit S n=1 Tax=Xylanibacter brevis TaxID=83231 RepID=UPI000694B505|nr:restriction endonuclease subunit S [Xylanibacter brevis]